VTLNQNIRKYYSNTCYWAVEISFSESVASSGRWWKFLHCHMDRYVGLCIWKLESVLWMGETCTPYYCRCFISHYYLHTFSLLWFLG